MNRSELIPQRVPDCRAGTMCRMVYQINRDALLSDPVSHIAAPAGT